MMMVPACWYDSADQCVVDKVHEYVKTQLTGAGGMVHVGWRWLENLCNARISECSRNFDNPGRVITAICLELRMASRLVTLEVLSIGIMVMLVTATLVTCLRPARRSAAGIIMRMRARR
jgi:hypothetical protein